MKGQRKGALLSRMMEGSAIALDSIQANKVRAALTILGVAIGVTVVIAMASARPRQVSPLSLIWRVFSPVWTMAV